MKPQSFPIEVVLPAKFYRDHLNRDCGTTGRIVKENQKLITASLDEAAWDDLFSDADFYISMIGSEDYEGNEDIVASAVRTMERLKKAVA